MSDKVFTPGPGRVFVFGSNRAGIHGAGAAATAHRLYGAAWGVGEGLTGDSYALPTMSGLADLAAAVERFVAFASSRPDLSFFVTRVGCGIAGHVDAEVAPLFRDAPNNCELPHGWR